MSKYLVFGAAGSIGSAVALKLRANNHIVDGIIRRLNSDSERYQLLKDAGVLIHDGIDVSSNDLLWFGRGMKANNVKMDGFVYAVGHCPPCGFAEAISHLMSEYPLEQYRREIDMYQIGVLNVFQCMLPQVKDGGSFVFISSAITRLKGKFPPFLHAHGYAGTKAAEDWLIDGMRHDPVVKKREIKIHRIAPAAVDTPFHHGEGPQPPKLVPIEVVANQVVHALASDEDVDLDILPE